MTSSTGWPAMLYLANPSTPAVRAEISSGSIGCIATPAQGNRIQPGWVWAADNGCYSDVWKASRWLNFLERRLPLVERCLFAVVPDKVSDAEETSRRWAMWAPIVREIGPYRLAFALQDGCCHVPWPEVDVLFIGGSTSYKLSSEAEEWAVEARERGRWVHWGRVNSRARFADFCRTGDSCDGTYVSFGPDINLQRLRGWLNHLPWTEGA